MSIESLALTSVLGIGAVLTYVFASERDNNAPAKPLIPELVQAKGLSVGLWTSIILAVLTVLSFFATPFVAAFHRS